MSTNIKTHRSNNSIGGKTTETGESEADSTGVANNKGEVKFL